MLRWLAMLLGPIFAKEMVEMARRKRYYFNRILYGLLLLFVLFIIWEHNSHWLGYGGSGALRAQARMAEEFYHGVAGVQYGAVLLFVPMFLAGVISGEREEKTLDLLLTTQLHDSEIILGKLLSRIAVVILIIFSGLPVLSLIMLMGGISPLGLALVTVATLLMILFCGAHAIYFSTTTKSPIGAMVRTYWWLGIWLLGVPLAAAMILAAVLQGLPFLTAQAIAAVAGCILLFINPIGPFVVALVPELYDGAASILGNWFFPLTLVLPTAWSSFLIWRAIRRLRGDVRPFAPWVKRFSGVSWLQRELSPLRGRLQAAWQRETAGWADDPLLRPVGNFLVGDVDNPLQQRARRARVFDRERIIGRIQWAGWIVIAFFLVLAGLAEPSDLGREEVSTMFHGWAWLGIVLLTAILAGTSLVGDRRRGFLEQMLVTPLTGRDVIDGTLLAVWEHMRRIALLPVLLGVLFCVTGASTILGVMGSLMTAALTCTLIALCGVGCSLPAKTLPSAMLATLVFPLTITIALAMVTGDFRYDHGPVLWVCAILLLPITLLWVRRRVNTGLVCAYMLATHLALVCLATCWTYDGGDDSLPGLAMNPAFWTIALLQDELTHVFRHTNSREWGVALVLYWVALIANFFWVRWWLIRNFDRLAGRAEQPEAAAAPPVVEADEDAVPVGAAVNH